MTKNQRTRDSAVMMSSTMPSAKYSCSGSAAHVCERQHCDRGLVGKREWFGVVDCSLRCCTCDFVIEPNSESPDWLRYVLHLLRSKILKSEWQHLPDVLVGSPEMHTPPGSAMAWRRAAMFTPSPKRSPSLTITSPTCTPMRKRT